MANSKAKASRSARTVAAVSATPTSRRESRPTKKVDDEPELLDEELDDGAVSETPRRPGPPLWLQLLSTALAVLGLVISAYETWAHYHGSRLAGCPTGGGGTFNCTAVITSPQSMVFGVIPVAVLGLLFYVAAVPLFSPWAWRIQPHRVRLLRWTLRIEPRAVHLVRLASVVVGMGFVLYLIYAELYQIGDICEYCTGVHIVTFLLFVITVLSAAIWGLGNERD